MTSGRGVKAYSKWVNPARAAIFLSAVLLLTLALACGSGEPATQPTSQQETTQTGTGTPQATEAATLQPTRRERARNFARTH